MKMNTNANVRFTWNKKSPFSFYVCITIENVSTQFSACVGPLFINSSIIHYFDQTILRKNKKKDQMIFKILPKVTS